MSVNREVNLCTFCYKRVPPNPPEEVPKEAGNSTSNCRDFQLKNFVEELEEFVGQRTADKLEELGEKGDFSAVLEDKEWLSCCEECGGIVKSCQVLHYQLKCLELRLEGELAPLVERMQKANRIPARVRLLNVGFKRSRDVGGFEEVDSFKTSRNKFITKCARRVSRSQPRVVVEQCSFYEVDTKQEPEEMEGNDNDDHMEVDFTEGMSADLEEIEANPEMAGKSESPEISHPSSPRSPVLSSDQQDDIQGQHSDFQGKDEEDKDNMAGDSEAGDPYPCSQPNCQLRFKTPLLLKAHLTLHGRFKCHFCPVTKTFAPNLALHELQHAPKATTSSTSPKSYQCPRCPSENNVIFNSKVDYIRHFLKFHLHFGEKKCPCPNCGVLVQGYQLKSHFNSFHNSAGLEPSQIFKCDQCPASFLRRYQLENHQFQSHYEKKCPTCGKVWKYSRKFWRHVKSCCAKKQAEEKVAEKKPNGGKGRCKLCGELTPNAQMLEHVQGHVGDYCLECPGGCQMVAPCSSVLRRHLQKTPNCREQAGGTEEKFTCDACNFSTDRIFILRNHLRRSHERSTVKPLQCPVTGCDAKYCVRQSVDIHLATHLFRRQVSQTCPVCGSHPRSEGMESHLRKSHDAPEILKCDQCPFVFSSRMDLIEHQYAHRGTGMSCDLCQDGVKFTRHAKLCEHYETVHSIPCKTFSCDLCSKKFGHRTLWYSHQFTEHRSDSKKATEKKNKWNCDLCLEVTAFATETDLISHKIRVHSAAEPFTCSICCKQFNSEGVLRKHRKAKHTGIPVQTEWKCEVTGCGQVFSFKSTLTKHQVKVHGALKPYICDVCGKSYSQPEGLRGHKQTVHLGLRPYVCEICGEAFGSGTVFKRHKLIHSGERPYECHICHQRFRQREALKPHLAAHEKKGAEFRPTGPMKHIRKRKTTTHS